ncbi:MAG: coproporphyrinogen dehydrogenase HemZ [Oscillospiraceae bacterium]|nr:coproporphyrinogen dehydrogenase HemZ [Oscillospiraceae bacterium]
MTLNNLEYSREMENLLRLFMAQEATADLYADENIARAAVSLGGRRAAREKAVTPCSPMMKDTDSSEIVLAQCLFHCLAELTGLSPPWGILTGVRPTKLFRRLAQKHGEEETRKYFAHELYVSGEKIALAREIYRQQQGIIAQNRHESFSLYVGIPFCPSRCSYCSFVSHSITNRNARKLIPEYIDKLREEIRAAGEIAKRLNLRLESIYFGGGTPTSLEPEQLAALLSEVERNFCLDHCREYTVEAGRADTITAEKLDVLRFFAVDRVSVNPQSFNDTVLSAIGRAHTAEDVRRAYAIVRQYGFAVNMDFIAGLPADSPQGFERTISEAIALNPENITIHALAIKRASALASQRHDDNGEWANTLWTLQNKLCDSYSPYYSYRQSNSIGGLENTGWAKKNHVSAYNIYMMEELHTVLACGAGGVTKLVRGEKNAEQYIQRVFNFKYPYEYISRFCELLERKHEILRFYSRLT